MLHAVVQVAYSHTLQHTSYGNAKLLGFYGNKAAFGANNSGKADPARLQTPIRH